LKIVFQGKKLAKSITEDRMVVGYHNPDLGLAATLHSRRGPIYRRGVIGHTVPLTGFIV
jgi:hypothetical protein